MVPSLRRPRGSDGGSRRAAESRGPECAGECSGALPAVQYREGWRGNMTASNSSVKDWLIYVIIPFACAFVITYCTVKTWGAGSENEQAQTGQTGCR